MWNAVCMGLSPPLPMHNLKVQLKSSLPFKGRDRCKGIAALHWHIPLLWGQCFWQCAIPYFEHCMYIYVVNFFVASLHNALRICVEKLVITKTVSENPLEIHGFILPQGRIKFKSFKTLENKWFYSSARKNVIKTLCMNVKTIGKIVFWLHSLSFILQ